MYTCILFDECVVHLHVHVQGTILFKNFAQQKCDAKKKNVHRKVILCRAICEFISNLKCLKLRYAVCTGTGVVCQGFTVVWLYHMHIMSRFYQK